MRNQNHLSIARALFSAVAITISVGIASTASAQVVQLPTFGTFSVGTTVNVPDRGGALLGGVTRGASASIERGVPGLGNVPYAGRLFRNRAIGTTRSPSTVSVHAYIIDFEAMDKALLAEAERIREARQNDPRFDRPKVPDEKVKEKAAFLSKNIGRNNKK